MPSTYFGRLARETPTRVWVNNPTIDEIGLALGEGAVGSTTNPAYAGGLLRRAPGVVLPVIEEAVAATGDDRVAAELVQQKLVGRIVERFLPLYESSEGLAGFVSIQGAPEADGEIDRIIAEARAGRTLGPNATPKLPATATGLAAFEVIVTDGSPTIVTEVFSLGQLVETCERYLSVTARMGHRPPFFVSPITGIFGDYLKAVTGGSEREVSRADIELMGVALSRACCQLVAEREYPVTLLCGGARIPFDLLGLVGAPVHATINWSTFAEVLAAEVTPSLRGIDEPIDQRIVDRLRAAFPDVRHALDIDGLTVEQFEHFGPVQHFRNNFVAGWEAVRAAITDRRMALA
ncbi:MAG: transaldolase family protein [Candidatus Dormiibacterota bacterium]